MLILCHSHEHNFPESQIVFDVFAVCSRASNVVACCNLFKTEDNLPISIELFVSLIEERPNPWVKSLDIYENKVATHNSRKEILINMYSDFETWKEKI